MFQLLHAVAMAEGQTLRDYHFADSLTMGKKDRQKQSNINPGISLARYDDVMYM
jgi:hypothetical protein